MGLFDKLKKNGVNPTEIPPYMKDRPQQEYFGPDGPENVKVRTYSYGGTNSYGNDDLYVGKSFNLKTDVKSTEIDEETGLTQGFLDRVEKEKKLKEEAEKYNNTKDYSANPITDSSLQPKKIIKTNAETFAEYDSKIDTSRLSTSTSSRKLTDYDLAMGRGNGEEKKAPNIIHPVVLPLRGDDTVNNNPMLGTSTPVSKENPYESSDINTRSLNPLLGTGAVREYKDYSPKLDGNTVNNNPLFRNS